MNEVKCVETESAARGRSGEGLPGKHRVARQSEARTSEEAPAVAGTPGLVCVFTRIAWVNGSYRTLYRLRIHSKGRRASAGAKRDASGPGNIARETTAGET